MAGRKDAEAKAKTTYANKMKDRGFKNYPINVTDGDVVSELTELARNTSADILAMGTSTDAPIDTGDSTNVGSFGETAQEIILWAPCPVMIIPPATVPRLA